MTFKRAMEYFNDMCERYKCNPCPFRDRVNAKGMRPRLACSAYIADHPDIAEEILKSYAAEHPIVTNFDLFGEVFDQEPWRDYVGKGDCCKTACVEHRPCAYCDWWKERITTDSREEKKDD